MPIQVLSASSYHQRFDAGRTRPCLFLCNGEGDEAPSEYIVKTKAGMDNGVNGLAAELLGAQLARFLDIPCPEPAIIDIDQDMVDSVLDFELKGNLLESIGLNFGSRFMHGYSTWPVAARVPSSLKGLATEIFAFDALTQNVDRRIQRPNVLYKGDEIIVIDHESSFSFLYALTNEAPYQISSLQFLSGHIFYPSLKGTALRLDRFAGALEALSDEVLEGMANDMPEAWRTDNLIRILNHIKEVRNNVDIFVEEVRRCLQ